MLLLSEAGAVEEIQQLDTLLAGCGGDAEHAFDEALAVVALY